MPVNMLKVASLCLLGIAVVQAATTVPPTTKHHNHHAHHTHTVYTGPTTTKEPNEHDSFRFSYDTNIHGIILVNSKNCYIFQLSDAERTAVHTDIGMRTLELKLLGTISSSVPTETPKDQVGTRAQHLCGGGTLHYYMM